MTGALTHSDLPTVCNFRATPSARQALAARSLDARDALAAMDASAQFDAIRDTRQLHHALFGGFAPARWPDAAGTYRGTPDTSVAAAPRAVFLARKVPGLRSRDMCMPASEVPEAMAAFALRLRVLWDNRPGHASAYRDAAYASLADTTAQFFSIHPFMDGNGHIWRLVLPVLADRLGLYARAEWTVDQRPYGPEFSLALQWYRDHPTILADQLRRWFMPHPGQAG